MEILRHLDRDPWRRTAADEEFLWLRLFRALDGVEAAIACRESSGDPEEAETLARLERLRVDIVGALRLVATGPSRS